MTEEAVLRLKNLVCFKTGANPNLHTYTRCHWKTSSYYEEVYLCANAVQTYGKKGENQIITFLEIDHHCFPAWGRVNSFNMKSNPFLQPAPLSLMDIWYRFPSINRSLWMKHCRSLTCSLVAMCSGLWTFSWNFATRWLHFCKPPATRLNHSDSGLSRISDCSSSNFPFWLCQEVMRFQIKVGVCKMLSSISGRDITWNNFSLCNQSLTGLLGG